MPRRIGLVTLHYNFKNFGALLQAYSLQRALKAHAPVVEIVDHRYRGKLKAIGPIRRKSHLASLRFFDTLDSSPTFISDDVRETEDYMESAYDTLVYGSDEIWRWEFSVMGRQRWNSRNTPVPNIYWPSPGLQTARVSYAPCSGTSGTRVPARVQRRLSASLRGFRAISVRDQPTRDMVHRLTGLSPQRVPDPVFLTDHTEACNFDVIRRKLEEAGADFRKPVVGVYQRRGVFRSFPADLSVVDLKEADLDPVEFWGAGKVVDLLATNTLHGTIVALVHNTPCIHAGKLKPKVRELCVRFGIPQGDAATVRDRWPHDAIRQKVQEERRAGLAWLAAALEKHGPD